MPVLFEDDFFRPPAGILVTTTNSTGGSSLKCSHFDEWGYGYEDASPNLAWVKWTNTASASYVSSAIQDAERAWGLWTDAGTSATTSITWNRWVHDAEQARAVIANMAYAVGQQQQRGPIETAEQRMRREAAEVKRAAEQKADGERRVKAQKRAKKLLQDCLTPEQLKCYEEHQFFDVVIDGKTYRIRQGTHGNVRLLDKDKDGKVKEVRSFCIQPGGVPDEDAMLSQKLLLEANEAEFLRIANARIIN
jgi:hypothetical protein